MLDVGARDSPAHTASWLANRLSIKVQQDTLSSEFQTKDDFLFPKARKVFFFLLTFSFELVGMRGGEEEEQRLPFDLIRRQDLSSGLDGGSGLPCLQRHQPAERGDD